MLKATRATNTSATQACFSAGDQSSGKTSAPCLARKITNSHRATYSSRCADRAQVDAQPALAAQKHPSGAQRGHDQQAPARVVEFES